MRKFLPVLLILFIGVLPNLIRANAGTDYVLYSQVANAQKTIYIVGSDGTDQRAIITDKNVKPFLVRHHILYYVNHQLFEYDLASQKTKILTKFSEDQIYVQALTDKPEAPDQALVIGQTAYDNNFYVLEFSDGSTRAVQSSILSGTNAAASGKIYSPDENGLAIIRQLGMSYSFDLSIQVKNNNKYKTIWTLPRNMTIIPERPLWAPNSRLLAFYAKQSTGPEGFYSLYLYNLDTNDFHLVQEQVFSKMLYSDLRMGPFVPEWSQDSKSLIFQYQPYGLPTSSIILKYEAATDKKTILTNSRGHNLYPSWSPSGKRILFVSNRDSAKDQVYTMDSNGENLKRLSPSEGYTEWASWYNPDGNSVDN